MADTAGIFVLLSVAWIGVYLARHVIKVGLKKREKAARFKKRVDQIVEAHEPPGFESSWPARRVY